MKYEEAVEANETLLKAAKFAGELIESLALDNERLRATPIADLQAELAEAREEIERLRRLLRSINYFASGKIDAATRKKIAELSLSY